MWTAPTFGENPPSCWCVLVLAHSARGVASSQALFRGVPLEQWFSNFLHQVPPQKIFGFPSTTIMTNIKMQYKWLLTAPGVYSQCVCVCVCVFTAVCVCTLDGLNAEHKFQVCNVTFTFSSTIHSLILIRIFIIVSLLKYSKYTV